MSCPTARRPAQLIRKLAPAEMLVLCEIGGVGAMVGLVMIVRDEAAVLPRLWGSVAGVVDRWTIVDTGSRDDTVAVARRLFAGLPGEVVSEEWRGFGASRNSVLLRAERATDWLLLLDADETFAGELDRSVLSRDVDAVLAEVRSANVSYWLPRLIRSQAGWRWRGRTHECLVSPAGTEARMVRTGAWWVDHHGDGGGRADKYERDMVLLAQDWEECREARTAFYMARTFDDMGRTAEAVEWYRVRLSLGGWDEELWYGRWRLGVCLLAMGQAGEGCAALEEAWRGRPWRVEPLVSLSEYFRQAGAWEQAWRACQRAFVSTGALPDGRGPDVGDDVLFIDTASYRWRVAYEASIVAWYVGERRRGRYLCDYLLSLEGLPAAIRDAVAANREFYVSRR